MANARVKNKASTKTAPRRQAGTKAKAARPTKTARTVAPAKATGTGASKVAKVRPLKVERPARPERPVERIEIKAPATANPEAFRLVSIERTEPPAGAAGRNWYRYTIRQGVNAINGYLQGTAAGVKTAAEQIVGQLNERRAGRWGYRTTRAAAPAASA
ncbi:MAG: hypothetical protein IT486_03840 [Gammaproteobacteria bacterium]|nr:hypothetical protein [Gammaproteobacteria bacterium]